MKQKIGLKTCWHEEQIATRIPHQPKILEIYLYDGDLENNLKGIEEGIRKMKKSGADITIHQPEFFRGKTMTIATTDRKLTENSLAGYMILTKLCRKHKLKGIILHPYSNNTYKPEVERTFKKLDQREFIKNLNKQKDLKKYAYLENIPTGFFSQAEDIAEIKKKTGAKLCIDLCHLYMTYQNNKEIERILAKITDNDDYFHIVDTQGKNHDSLEIGEGEIDFRRIRKYIRQGIIEVNCQNQITADEMIRSYYKFKKISATSKAERICELTKKFLRNVKKQICNNQASFQEHEQSRI